MKVSEQQPYTVRENTWCFSFPPRCSKYKVVYRTVYKEQVSYLICEVLSNFTDGGGVRSGFVFPACYRDKTKTVQKIAKKQLSAERHELRFVSCRNWSNKGLWKNAAKATRRPRAAIVAFQSVRRIAATVLVSRPTSANASRGTAVRYVISVSTVLFFF